MFDGLDTSLKDGLFHEFRKFGKVFQVLNTWNFREFVGLVFFRQQRGPRKATNTSKENFSLACELESNSMDRAG